MTDGISAGTLWKGFKNHIASMIRYGVYTLDAPDNASIIEIREGIWQESRTGVIFPIEQYMAHLENESIHMSSAVFNFQVLMRLSGANSYESLADLIVKATDIANDVLLALYTNPKAIDKSVVRLECVEHNPVGFTRSDSKVDGDWLIVVSPKFKVYWCPQYSQDAFIDGTGSGNNGDATSDVNDDNNPGGAYDEGGFEVTQLTSGIFISKVNNLDDKVKDYEFVITDDDFQPGN